MGPTDRGWHDIPGGGMDKQAYWDGQQWTGETRSKPSPPRRILLIVAVTVPFLLVGAGFAAVSWYANAFTDQSTYLVGGEMIDDVLVAAKAPYTEDHLMNEVALVLDECGTDTATGTITNNSEVALDATIAVRLTQSSGAYVDTAMDLVDDVPPGQTTTWKAFIFDVYDQCEADVYSVSGPKLDLLSGVSNKLRYCSTTFMLMDVASGHLATETVVAEYLELARDPTLSPESFDYSIGPPCYLPDGEWKGTGTGQP